MEMLSDEMAGGLLLGAVGATIIMIQLAVYVVKMIAGWRIFTKAGEKGWKSLIPLYNLYVEYGLTWKANMAILIIGLTVAGQIVQRIGGEGNLLTSLVSMVISITTLVLEIIGWNKLAKAFGKGTGFTWGLVLLQPVFVIILGFGSAQYIGNTTER